MKMFTTVVLFLLIYLPTLLYSQTVYTPDALNNLEVYAVIDQIVEGSMNNGETNANEPENAEDYINIYFRVFLNVLDPGDLLVYEDDDDPPYLVTSFTLGTDPEVACVNWICTNAQACTQLSTYDDNSGNTVISLTNSLIDCYGGNITANLVMPEPPTQYNFSAEIDLLEAYVENESGLIEAFDFHDFHAFYMIDYTSFMQSCTGNNGGNSKPKPAAGEKNLVPENDVSIWPNPASANLTIRSGDRPLETIELIGLQGQLMDKITGIRNREFKMDLSGLPTGMYLLRVMNSSGIYVEKIVVE